MQVPIPAGRASADSRAGSDGGFLRTAMMERGGRGKNRSITRTRGVRKFSILICHKPKVFLRNTRPFSHQAGEPNTVERHEGLKLKARAGGESR